MSDFALFVLFRTGLDYLWTGSAFCFVLAAELAFPRCKLPPVSARYRVLTFAAIFFPLANMFSWASASTVPAFTPLIALPDWGMAGAFLVVAAYLLIGDFIYYWFHRLQHAVPLLWRFHAIHHSIQEMGAGANYHHVMESIFKALLVAIPTSLLFSGGDLVVIGILIGFHGYYSHSATALNFGAMGRLVPDNRTHRIHHSREERHFEKNFGGATMIWDWLFRTAYFPTKDEWPDTGLSDQPEPQTASEYLLRPFKPTPVASYNPL